MSLSNLSNHQGIKSVEMERRKASKVEKNESGTSTGKVNWQPTDWIIYQLSISFSNLLQLYNVVHLYYGHEEEDNKRINLGCHSATGNRLIYPFIFSWHFNFNIDDRTDLPIHCCQYSCLPCYAREHDRI